MNAKLQHEISVSHVCLFQATGRLLAEAKNVEREREKLLALLKHIDPEDRQREGSTDAK